MCEKPDTYKDLREKWCHEDELINHRLTWLLLSQTLLFAGYGVLSACLVSEEEKCVAMHLSHVNFLVLGIPIFGLIICGIAFLGISAAIAAMIKIRRKKRDVAHGSAITWMGHASTISLVFVFIVAWIFVLKDLRP